MRWEYVGHMQIFPRMIVLLQYKTEDNIMANEKIFPKAYDEYQTSAKNSVQLLAKIARGLGYRDCTNAMPESDRNQQTVIVSDIIDMLKDNDCMVYAIIETLTKDGRIMFYDKVSLPDDVKEKVRKYIKEHWREHVDECNEINCTGLAEACAEEFGFYTDTECTIHGEVFDLAAEFENDKEDVES